MSCNWSTIRVWLLVNILAASLGGTSAFAQGGTVLRVDPSTSSIRVNDAVNIAIKVDNIASLTAFEIHLSFDPIVLEVTSLANGGFVAADVVAQNTYDNAAGTVDYAIAQLNHSPTQGSGTLLTIAFRAKGNGNSQVTTRATPAAPDGFILSDQNGMSIPSSWLPGTINVGPVNPTNTDTPTPTSTLTHYFSGGDAPSWMFTARTPEEMRALYEAWNDQIDGVKVYTGIPEDQFIVLLEAAHADGLFVTGHLGSISGMRAIELGIDGIEHGLFSMSEFFPQIPSTSFRAQYCAISQLDVMSPEVTSIVEALVRQGTYLDPTIVVFQPELPDFEPLVSDWEKYLDPNAVMPLRRTIRSMIQPTCLHEALEKQSQFVKAVHDLGGLIVTGTDPVIPILLPGYSLHRELQNLVNAGLSPLEAIKAATLNAATAIHLEAQKGTIAAGKIADLVVVDGNPDEDIAAIGNNRLVFKEGIPYMPEALRKSVEGEIGKEK